MIERRRTANVYGSMFEARRWIPVMLLLGVLRCPGTCWTDEVTPAANTVTADERDEVRRFVAAKFFGRADVRPSRGHLTLSLTGKLLKNHATTKVYHSEVGALPLKIADKEYSRGLYCPSVGTIKVTLPSPGRTFKAIFGLDSNRVQSFYSNAGQGSVVATVDVDGDQRFQSGVMREGIPGVPVQVALQGANEFTLSMQDAGAGVVERVDFNQPDWADARVNLVDGRTVWLGDLPTAPLGGNFSTQIPFSFRIAGRPWRDVADRWRRTQATKTLDDARLEHTLTFTDPETGLQVRCVAVEYNDFPVVEWKLLLKNTGSKPTPMLEDILPLDLNLERDNEGEFVLHHANGSPHSLVKMSDVTDYAPRESTLGPDSTLSLGAKLGLPAANDLPMFNLHWNDRGAIVAIGWPGQWAGTLQRDKDRGLRLKFGQQKTHFQLLPGEEVRTPLIAVLLWRGSDRIRAQNLWRRWMIAHNLPRTGDGKLPPHQFAASSSAYTMESSRATEQNQTAFINRYLEENIGLDYWWIDAGWYEYDDYWLNVGTWRPDGKRFPRGLRPISDHLHANDMKMILWFTPECVTRGSSIDRERPAWLLRGGGQWWMGHALIQGETAGSVNDSGLTLMEEVASFGIGNPDATITGRTDLADGSWHLVTATRLVNAQTGRSELRLYVDGRLEASGESPNVAALDANATWGVGRQNQSRGIVGDIDDVRVYDVALTEAQVASLYAGSEHTAPQAHYPFDGTIDDDDGKRHGNKTGTGTLAFVGRPTSAQAGDRNQVLRFDNDYGIEIPNDAHRNFTLSCWVRMDAPQPPPWGRGDYRLFDFRKPEAVRWLTDHIDQRIVQHGVDLYRHDGIPPLQYWRSADAPNRQGIAEIRHVEGLLRFWDELRRRHPNLRIDVCSGGGSRNDLEALRRAVPLWRSDYAYETTGMQSLTYGMSLWIPYFGTGISEFDAYTFLSQMAPANSTSWDLRRTDSDYDFCRKMVAMRREVTRHYYGDFYPLTTYRTDNDVWMAWQFDQPDTGDGMVQAFRRPDSSTIAMRFKLHGLDRAGRYRVQSMLNEFSVVISGKQLMDEGLTVNLMKPRQADLIRYELISAVEKGETANGR